MEQGVVVKARIQGTYIMTYDPNNPNGIDDRRVVRDREGMSGAMMAGIAFALALALGVLFYAMNRDDRTASTTTSSPPATTGQTQKSPAPAPSLPPAPAPKAQ
jgi:hypothetical protein